MAISDASNNATSNNDAYLSPAELRHQRRKRAEAAKANRKRAKSITKQFPREEKEEAAPPEKMDRESLIKYAPIGHLPPGRVPGKPKTKKAIGAWKTVKAGLR